MEKYYQNLMENEAEKNGSFGFDYRYRVNNGAIDGIFFFIGIYELLDDIWWCNLHRKEKNSFNNLYLSIHSKNNNIPSKANKQTQ